MNEVSVYMDPCVRVWEKGRRESWLLNFTYLSLSLYIGFYDYVHMYHSNSQLTA